MIEVLYHYFVIIPNAHPTSLVPDTIPKESHYEFSHY